MMGLNANSNALALNALPDFNPIRALMRRLSVTVWSGVLGLLLVAGFANAQEFDRLHPDSIQPQLSQPLQWVGAVNPAQTGLPDAFLINPGNWAFQAYTDSTSLPTSAGSNAWARFTLAATNAPQSWIVRVPKNTIDKVSLHKALPDGSWQVQAAGMAIAPAQWSLPAREPTFEVQSSSEPQTYFMRFEHSEPIAERPELMSPIDFADDASRVGTLIGLMFGMSGIFMVMCIAAFRLADSTAFNTVFLSLAAFIATILLTNLVLMGYGGWRLWPDSVYLNQAMRWTAPLLTLAAGSWFCLQASYAKATSTAIYRLLVFAACGSLLLAGVTFATAGDLPHNVFNGWVAFVLAAEVISLLWLCLHGQRWNWWLLSGLMPIAAAAAGRLAYNFGWHSQADLAQTASVFLTEAGLMWLFLALAWRSRAALLTNERKLAFQSYDAATGLTLASVVKVFLPRLLLRAERQNLSCGVMLIRWVDYDKKMRALSFGQRSDALALFGRLLQRVVRDIDTAACFDNGDFLVLIEGPVNRTALASLGTQVISSCLRASSKAGKPGLFDLHIAIWQSVEQAATSNDVLEQLNTRLSQMSAGTQRAVQFVDTASTVPAADSAQARTLRSQQVIDKINAIESSPRLPPIAITKRRSTRR